MMISDDNVTINQDYQISSQTQLSSVDSDFKRDGYKIAYWTSKADGTGTRYDLDSIVNAAQVSDDLDFYAQWEKIVEKFNLSAFVYPDGAGTVNNESPFISNDIEAGSAINLTAKKTYGHAFVNWSDGETQPERAVEMNATSSLTANFMNVSAELLLGVNDSAKGSTIGSGLIGYSESRGISAVANYGYEFTGWTKDEGGCEIEDTSLSATTLTSNSESQISVTANFKAMTLSVEYDAGYEKPLENQLYFEAQEAGSTIKLQNVAGTYKTSTDGKNWSDYELGTLCTLTNVGDKIYFSARDKNATCWNDDYNTKFSMSGKIAAKGNIQYLLDSTGECLSVPNYCYCYMFYHCTSLTQASVLPATTLAEYCYCCMFQSCTSLTQAPVLPATTLANYCYAAMFYSCTSLSSVPILSATTLADECYQNMFNNCSSLTQAPELPATTLAYSCYQGMFQNCTSLSSAPELPATTLANYCYCYMFYNCTSLTQASELPATTLANECYQCMFQNCTSLTQASVLPATTLAEYCYDSMFWNCTSLTQAPELPAKTLANYCYYGMFRNCSHLSVTTDQTKQGAYQILSVGSTTASKWGTDMFTGTTGDFTGTPTTGTPYYCWGN